MINPTDLPASHTNNIIDTFENVEQIKNLSDKTVVILKPESCNINFVDVDAGERDRKVLFIDDYSLTIIVSIQIKYWIVNNKITDSYYIISYSTPNMNEKNKIYHPFYNDNSYDDCCYEGEIIKKNAMTEQMVNYLTMDEDELSQYTGNTIPQDYKGFIMKSLSNFWD